MIDNLDSFVPLGFSAFGRLWLYDADGVPQEVTEDSVEILPGVTWERNAPEDD